ncbi:MAG: hypothetical protein V3U88_08485 [Methylococcales bacterium]
MQSTINSRQTLTSEAAKKLFFEHWNFLQSLASKRFPNDSAMGEQALNYVLDKLEEHDWKRVKCWDNNSSFATFIAVFATRLITDFVRLKFGYHRPPAWLLKKQEDEWKKAFKLCTVDKYERREALEILYSEASTMNRSEIEDIVNTVYSKCNKQARFSEGNLALDQIIEPLSKDNPASEQSNIYNKQLIEVLIEFIQSDEVSFKAIADDTLKDVLNHLKSHINMSDEDRLLLRLRFCEGLKIKEISQILDLEGNLYKRINGLIDDLRRACQQSGLIAA